MSLALITGASSGIGKAIAQQLAAKGYDLYLIARREEKLQQLANLLEKNHAINVYVQAVDLTDDKTTQQIVASLKQLHLSVALLVNNAGFGGLGKFANQSLDRHTSMIDLNISAVVKLTYHLLPELTSNQGKILNVGSTAGFMPGPLQATYFATKAFVNSRSQALAQELEDTGVTVTVLCPGATKTEFAESADAESISMFQGDIETADDVARKGINGVLQGKRVVITDWKLWFTITFVLPVLPRTFQAKMIEKIQTKE